LEVDQEPGPFVLSLKVKRSSDRAEKAEDYAALTLSRGKGVGKVAFLHDHDRTPLRTHLPEADVQSEIERFSAAYEKCRLQLSDLSISALQVPSPDSSAIFDAQLLILESSRLKEKVIERIADHKINAEWALERVSELFHDDFAEIEDPRFREKVGEIDDVIGRIRNTLKATGKPDLSDLKGAVVAAREIRTSRFYDLCEAGPAAIILEHGGWTSHVSIIAREFGIPMVSGLGNPLKLFHEGQKLVVDGDRGIVVINDEGSNDSLSRSLDFADNANNGTQPLFTADGTEIRLCGNADNVASTKRALSRGAYGIGLYRTDGLIGPDGEPPAENEQFAVYSEVIKAASGSPVNIRTFDFGIESFRTQNTGNNPALGLRSLRLCLSRPQLFGPQIRALLRAGRSSGLRLLLPMVSGVSDIRDARSMIENIAAELLSRDTDITIPPVGVMIELPSAVLSIDDIIEEADFVCVGTNDLVQYLLGADRDNELVANWYQSLHPSVLKALELIVGACRRAEKEAIVCGEMASAPFYLPVLLGLGFRHFSLHSGSFGAARKLISQISLPECEKVAVCALSSKTADQAEEFLYSHYRSNWPHLFPEGMLERSAGKVTISES
jgi:phosphotransferase system enzyme I (PtsI)